MWTNSGLISPVPEAILTVKEDLGLTVVVEVDRAVGALHARVISKFQLPRKATTLAAGGLTMRSTKAASFSKASAFSSS